jgi:uncharacterized protein YyaL (SSP411 family)
MTALWMRQRKRARQILAMMRDPAAGLLRVARGGPAKIPAILEDYAFLVDGLLALHEARPEGWALAAARELLDDAGRLFGREGGGYFDTRAGQADLFIRARIHA